MLKLSLTTLVVALLTPLAFCQSPPGVDERLRKLEEANQRILSELQTTKQENSVLKSEMVLLRNETENLRDQALENDGLALEEQINVLINDTVQDAAWTKATRSGLPMRFYGFIRMDSYYNDSKTTLDPILVFAVLPEGGGVQNNDDSFVFETRLVRFGFDIDAGEIGGAKVSAKLETDFANFILARESRQTPRIRLAYIDLDWGEVSMRFGQDWDVISPLYPQANNELLMWGAGNTGDRRPQIQFSWMPESDGGTQFGLEASLGLSGGVDGVNNDGNANVFSELDGYDSGHPHGQLRLSLAFDSHVANARAALGAWGYLARIETDTAFNGEKHYTPWLVGVDFNLPVVTNLTLRAEAWYGQALSDVRGNILQSINRTAGDEIAGWGGWAELRLNASDNLLLVLGASIDDPKNSDLEAGARSLNWTAYLSGRYDWGGGLFTGLEVIYWETEWGSAGKGDLIRVASYIQLNF